MTEYRTLLAKSSTGEIIDANELLEAGAEAGRSPGEVFSDLTRANAAFAAWRRIIFNPAGNTGNTQEKEAQPW